ncbi:DUF5683 domain-containing protein [Mucilaginibacter sp. CSA2-8R]|uniref:DUF5683 domain-containing protein n=1 Tax=Mucilaginibacter sp. CSA2-8R TaxID=3141542 RepID=UPI00315D8B8F
MNRLIIGCLLVFLSLAAFAQKPDTVKTVNRKDSLNRVIDSAKSKPILQQVFNKKNKKQYNPDSTHLPSTAVKRSLMVPGWGQVYNKHWWKLPLIYGGIGSFVYFAIINKRDAKNYLEVYKLKRDPLSPRPDPNSAVGQLYARTSTYGAQALADASNGSDRNFQLCIFGIIGVWGIQTIDAYIFAKFIHSYTMDRDLSFKIAPGIITGPTYASNGIPSVMPVLKLTFSLK